MAAGVVFLAATMACAQPIREVDVDEREDFALMVLVPSGAMRGVSLSEIYSGLDEVLRERTPFRLRTLEDETAGGKECKSGELSCFSRVAREHTNARFLMVIAVRGRDALGDLLHAIVVDNSKVEKLRSGFGPLSEKESFEDALLERAAHTFSAREVSSRAELRAALVFWTADELIPICGSVCEISPASLEVEAQHPLEVWLDGKLVATLGEGRTFLSGIRPGLRTFSFRAVERVASERSLLLESGRVERVNLSLPVMVGAEIRVARSATFWTGLGAFSAGAGVMIYAALAPSDGKVICFDSPSGTGCGPRGSASSGFDGSVDRSTVPIVPLGASLMLMGAGWSIAELIGDEGEFPWIEIGIGVAAFAASMTTFLMLDGTPAP